MRACVTAFELLTDNDLIVKLEVCVLLVFRKSRLEYELQIFESKNSPTLISKSLALFGWSRQTIA